MTKKIGFAIKFIEGGGDKFLSMQFDLSAVIMTRIFIALFLTLTLANRSHGNVTCTKIIKKVDTIGDVGRTCDIAVDSNTHIHISYRDFTNGDLKYAKWNGFAWSLETIDLVGDVGSFTSISIDLNCRPHISYYDLTNGDLKYANWDGVTWQIQTIDSGGNVGVCTALVIDDNSMVHISYYDFTNGNLKYANWDGATWQIKTVDSGGDVGWYTSIGLDSNNYPCISYYDITNQDLKYARWNGSVWSIETVDSVGGYTSLDVDTNNYPHISYFDATNGNLKYAKWNGSSWGIEVVDSVGKVGDYNSLSLTSDNLPRISYYDNTNKDIKYAAWNGILWNVFVTDSIDGACHGISLDIDLNNCQHIAYYDIINGDLKYASVTDNPTLSWTGESNYSSDGLNPECGTSTTTFFFKIKYTDLNNNPPLQNYPKVYILQGGTTVQILSMNYETGTYGMGAIYSTSTCFLPARDYVYHFVAYDVWGAEAFEGAGVEFIDAPNLNDAPCNILTIFPEHSAIISRVMSNPAFQWSFEDVDGDSQIAVQIQVRYSTGTYADSISKDSGVIAFSSNTWVPTDWNLFSGNTYYWRVKVKDNSNFENAWSTWAIETPFYIAYNIIPDKPANFSPTEGVHIIDSNSELVWSEFNDADGDLQVLIRVQLRVSTGSYGDVNSKDSGEVLNSLNTWTSTDWNLLPGNTYYWRVKVKDNSGFDNCWSEWSNESSFVKLPQAPTGIKINPPVGETQIKDNDTIVITGTAEAGTMCEIVIKDQNGKTLTSGITTANLSVGQDGLINAQVSLGKITENYPLATKVQVEVSLIDPAGNTSAAASSSFVVFKAEKEEVKLYDNLMNPADGKPVTIRYELPSASLVTIQVYNRNGTLIKKIIDNQSMGAGVYTAEWLGKNTGGNIVASGIYVIHVKTDSYSKILKAVVVK